MATAYKVLGQLAPTAAQASTAYTCPASTQTVVSTISVANRGTATDYFRIAVRPNAEAINDKHYICYDTKIDVNDSIFFTIGITIDASDVITVYSEKGTTSFNIFGSEIT